MDRKENKGDKLDIIGLKDEIGMIGIERMKINGYGCMKVKYIGNKL